MSFSGFPTVVDARRHVDSERTRLNDLKRSLDQLDAELVSRRAAFDDDQRRQTQKLVERERDLRAKEETFEKVQR